MENKKYAMEKWKIKLEERRDLIIGRVNDLFKQLTKHTRDDVEDKYEQLLRQLM